MNRNKKQKFSTELMPNLARGNDMNQDYLKNESLNPLTKKSSLKSIDDILASGKSALLCGLLILLVVVSSLAQGTPAQYTNNNKDNALKGSGRVNPSTLAMEFDLPLGNYPGRGINIPISLSYSSKVWRLDDVGQEVLTPGQNCYTSYDPVFSEKAASGWTTSLDVPYVEYVGWDNRYDQGGFPFVGLEPDCPGPPSPGSFHIIKKVVVHLPSGGTHELRVNDTPASYPTDQSPPSKNGTYYSVDGSNIKFVKTGSTSKLHMPDGSYYHFLGSTTKFYDRNGNFTTYNHSTKVWTDTLGRTLSAPFDPEVPTTPTTAGNPQIYNIPGLGGSDVTYKLHWKKLDGGTQAESALTDISDPAYNLQYIGDRYGVWGSYSYRTNALFHSGHFTYGRVRGGDEIFNPVVLTEIELPTGQSYKFSYDVFGRIEKITYPTGGSETFTYSEIPGLAKTGAGDVHKQMNYGVTTRVLSESTGGSSYTWNYSAMHVAPKGYMIEIENPDGIMTKRFLHRSNDPNPGATQGSFGYDSGLAGMVYKVATFDKNDHPISQTLTNWTTTSFSVNSQTEADWHPRVTHTESYVYDPNDSSKFVWATTKFEYEDEANLNLRETPVLKKKTLQFEYEASSGSSYAPIPGPNDEPDPNPTPIPTPLPPDLIRTSEVTYLINDSSIAPATRDIYKNKHILGLTTESTIKDSSGTIVSKSETLYDESGYSPAVGRGNPTTARVWDSTKGTVTNANAYIETHAKFDTWGNQTESTDALGRTTITTFDSVDHAFPIKVTTPIPDPSGTNGSNTAFVTEVTFDFNSSTNSGTGLPLTKTDANGQVTSFEYDPITQRLRKATPPSGGSIVEKIYNDQPNDHWVKTRAQIDANNWVESITYFDGLGRAYKTEQAHSEGNIFVEKEFDAEGRVHRITNPFRSGEAKQYTTSVYDDAGRVIEVQLQDGAKILTDYAVSTTGAVGTTKQITDQAGKKRKGFSDVLGRMVRVVEDPDGEALNTDYVFDTLGNLREAIQGEQRRYFMYDSIGRLLYSKQPEQDANSGFVATDSITSNTIWSNKYIYDDGRNIISTTNARGVSVTATYDDFNRVILTNYSDSTPDVQFYYDGRGLGSVPQYSKGKKTKVSSSVSETRYTSFDNLGRLLTHEQRTTAGQLAGTETAYQTAYSYNLSGAILTETYPSGRIMTHNYRQDGELDNLWGTRAGQGSEKRYLDQISYNTLGDIEKMRFGNNKWETTQYNIRQQVSQIGLGHSESDTSLLNIDYRYGTVTQNNGALRQQNINFSGLTNEIVQDYTYDDLNRLESATENANSVQSWKQTFNYDRYGNRTFDTAHTTTIGQSDKVTNPTIQTSNNRMTEDQDGDSSVDYEYDNTGNVTVDAENQRFIYDAENRIREFFRGTNGGSTADATYDYDGDGRRIRKVRDQTETIFVYNGSGLLVAEYSNELPQNPKTSYLTEDHLGSPRIITDEGGFVVSRHDYLAFGREVTEAVGNIGGRSNSQGFGQSDEIRKQYTGYERDHESGLDYAQARYYNSSLGRFTSVDPLTASADVKNPQTFNRYAYVLNSPYKFADPLGLVPQPIGAGGYIGTNWGAGCDVMYQSCVQENWSGPGGFADPTVPLPAAVKKQVTAKEESIDSVSVKFEPDSPHYEENNVDLVLNQSAINQLGEDGEYAYNQGLREQAMFTEVMKELDQLEKAIGAALPSIPGAQKEIKDFKIDRSDMKVGESINFNPVTLGASVGVDAKVVNGNYGKEISFISERISEYNKIVSSTNIGLRLRKVKFADSGKNVAGANVRIKYGTVNTISGPYRSSETGKLRDVMEITHQRRMSIARGAGHRRMQ